MPMPPLVRMEHSVILASLFPEIMRQRLLAADVICCEGFLQLIGCRDHASIFRATQADSCLRNHKLSRLDVTASVQQKFSERLSSLERVEDRILGGGRNNNAARG
eukprot:808486-Rhodomonas_salina.1